MLVYILNKNGQPLMPTKRCGKVRRMLKSGEAKVVKRCPFVIQLMYESTNHTQDVTLGVDAGYKTIGLSATTENEELYASEVTLRDDIVELLSTRREARRARRSRKTRYRKPRFSNRIKSKHKGWLAPSVEQRIGCHLTSINNICKILPISSIIVETAAFDIQLLKATLEGKPLPEGVDYQNGEQLGFWNTREYVLFRDGYTCQCCKGKSKDKVLNVHHIESRKTGGDRPDNLITLCKTCHKGFHEGKIKLPYAIKKKVGFKAEAFMGIMRWTLYNRLKDIYPDVHMTYGYLTKYNRIKNKLPKEHCIDARVISGHPKAKALGYVFFQKKVRCHNRQLHKFNTSKGGVRKANQATYEVKGFHLFDKVLFEGKECFIYGRRTSGYFDIRMLDGTSVHKSASYKKLKLLETRKSYLTERRLQGEEAAIPPAT